jgi:NAD(P)-dependent dehydrogenase (short-subunit alcohol dehydrogenase family)
MSTVLITGANRGLGLEFCRQYAQAGWTVIACCRDPKAADALHDLAASFPSISIHQLEVTDFPRVDALARELAAKAVDVLLCNAAIYGDESGKGFGSIDYGRWTDTFRINTQAPVKLVEAFMPHLLRSQRKLVVAISSLMGSMTDNRGGGSIYYRSSKAALNAAMKSLSIDLKPQGIGVLILHPGWVKTDMGGSNAPTEPTESIGGMIAVIDAFRSEQSGRFVNFRGEELPW